jgi:hypothetical protein
MLFLGPETMILGAAKQVSGNRDLTKIKYG